jgi:hypothetical protein
MQRQKQKKIENKYTTRQNTMYSQSHISLRLLKEETYPTVFLHIDTKRTRTSRRVSRLAFMAASLGVSFLNKFIMVKER